MKRPMNCSYYTCAYPVSCYTWTRIQSIVSQSRFCMLLLTAKPGILQISALHISLSTHCLCMITKRQLSFWATCHWRMQRFELCSVCRNFTHLVYPLQGREGSKCSTRGVSQGDSAGDCQDPERFLYNLISAERRCLQTIKANADLTVLTDNGGPQHFWLQSEYHCPTGGPGPQEAEHVLLRRQRVRVFSPKNSHNFSHIFGGLIGFLGSPTSTRKGSS
jgi:hypothetical protein